MEVIKNECISKLEVVRILQKAYTECRIQAKDGLVSILDDINAADVQPVVRWISVDESLPENDADCLVWYKCDTAFGKSESWGIAHCSRCDWYTKHLDGDNIVVHYWHPLPEPPKAIKG